MGDMLYWEVRDAAVGGRVARVGGRCGWELQRVVMLKNRGMWGLTRLRGDLRR